MAKDNRSEIRRYSTVIMVSLMAFLFTTTGCGPTSAQIGASDNRLHAIDIMQVGSSIATQTGRFVFTYLGNGNPDKVFHYSQPGSDAKWGTLDDKSDFYITCAFSSSAASKSVDFQGELSEGLRTIYTVAPAKVNGIASMDVVRACGLNYVGQGALVEQVYDVGADGQPLTADDVKRLQLNWSLVSGDHSHLAITASGYAGDSHDFYYRASPNKVFNYIVTEGIYRSYEFNTDSRVKAVERWTTAIAPASWVMPLSFDTRLDAMTNAYGKSTVERCSRNGSGDPLFLDVDSYNANLPTLLTHYGAGADGVACTGDDKPTIQENYILEKAG